MRDEGGQKDGNDLDWSAFLFRLCHDLRSALRSVRTEAELILRDRTGVQVPGLDERLGQIVQGTQKIDLLADGVASYSIALQIDPGSFQPVPLAVLIRTVLAKLDREIRADEAKVTYDRLPRVSGDPDRLMEVFEKLLRNALRHRGAEAPRIHITVQGQQNEWLFALRDNGPGLEPDSLEKIFEPFARVHGQRPAGIGLGLATCHKIVERHGGRMWAESPPGGGTAILFTLPAEGET